MNAKLQAVLSALKSAASKLSLASLGVGVAIGYFGKPIIHLVATGLLALAKLLLKL